MDKGLFFPVPRSRVSPRERVSLSFVGVGRTKQGFKAECDINTIMGRYKATGVLPDFSDRSPVYSDSSGWDFREAMELVAGARSQFEAMPSALRARFDNDPARFLEFVDDPRNRSELGSMGLLSPAALERDRLAAAAQVVVPGAAAAVVPAAVVAV